MEVISKNCSIDTYSEKKPDRPLISISKNFDIRNLKNRTQEKPYQVIKKKACMRIFRGLDLNFSSLVLKNEFSFAYNHVMDNLTEDLKEGSKLLGNNNNLCAVLYFILARKNNYLVKKSNLSKLLGIKISHFNTVFHILAKMPYFNKIVIIARTKKKMGKLKEVISISGTPIKKKKKHKKMKVDSSKAECPNLKFFTQFLKGVPKLPYFFP